MSQTAMPIDLLARLVDCLVKGDYVAAADLTRSDRLSVEEIRWAVNQLRPHPGADTRRRVTLLDVVAIDRPVQGEAWSVHLPLWTAELSGASHRASWGNGPYGTGCGENFTILLGLSTQYPWTRT
jgi:hypothetical protein